MSRFSYSDDVLNKLFRDTKTVALVGASPRGERRASWRVMRFWQQHGYKVYPVNPEAVGQEIHGEKVYAAIGDLPEKVDLVDIFRRSRKVAPVVDDAIAAGAPYIWLQLDVIDEDAAAKAEAAGATVIMDRCPAIELPRLQRTA